MPIVLTHLIPRLLQRVGIGRNVALVDVELVVVLVVVVTIVV